MSDQSQPFDLQSYLAQTAAKIPQSMDQTQGALSRLQGYIQNQQDTQANIPALQFAAGMLKPTKTGSFSESVGEAGSGALNALQSQRSIDLERASKIASLEEAKQNLLTQQLTALLPYGKMMNVQSVMGGGSGAAPGGAPAVGGAGAAPAGAPQDVGAAKVADYQRKINALLAWNPEAAAIQQKQMEADPDVAAYKARLTGTAEASAKAPYELVEMTAADGSKHMVPKSALVGGGAKAAIAPPGTGATGSSASPSSAPGIQTSPTKSQETGLEMAAEEAKKVPTSLTSLEEQDQRMQAIDDVMQKYQSGALAEPKGDALALLRSAGINVKDTDTASPAALQIFRKNAIGEMFAKVKELGGQVKVAEITGMGKVVNDPDIQPEANAAISAQTRGLIDWTKDRMNDYGTEYHAGKITDPSTWTAQWIKDHPLNGYIANRLANTPVKGVPLTSLPNNGLGIADKDYSDSKGNVVARKGDKVINFGGQFVPIDRVGDYYKLKAAQ